MRQYWPGCLECQQPEGKEEWGDQIGDQQQFVGQTQDLPNQINHVGLTIDLAVDLPHVWCYLQLYIYILQRLQLQNDCWQLRLSQFEGHFSKHHLFDQSSPLNKIKSLLT